MDRWIVIIICLISYNVCSQSKKQIDSISNIPVNYIQTHLKQTIPLLQKNVQHAKKTKNIKAEAKTSALLALAYYYGGDYDENMKYALQAITLFEKLGDKENSAKEYGELGFRIKATNLPDAERYMIKGMKMAEKENFSKPLLSIYNNYGVVKDLMKQPDSAIFYYFKGLAIKEKVKDSVGIPYSLNNIGEAYLKKQNYKLAKSYFDKAMKMRQDMKDDYGIADNYAYNGDLYFAMKQYTAAIVEYEQSLKISQKYKITNLLRHNYNMLSQSYELSNQLPKALEYYKKNQNFKDSLINKETYDKMAELQLKFDTADKEKQILEQKVIQRKKSNTIKILAILIGSLILVSLAYYRYLKLKNKSQKHEFELSTAIQKIENQNKLQEQRLQISRDLHDNIGAQLTFIISAIDTVKSRFTITDNAINNKLSNIRDFTKDTITELRDTIWAMNLSEISIEELQQRIMNLIEKAHTSHENVHINFICDAQLQNKTFTSTQGMNLYRIMQEAVNNALKYANPSEIEIDFQKNEKYIKLNISDNGDGFSFDEITPGSGLFNMKKRAKEIDADLQITSQKTKGTIVTLLITEH